MCWIARPSKSSATDDGATDFFDVHAHKNACTRQPNGKAHLVCSVFRSLGPALHERARKPELQNFHPALTGGVDCSARSHGLGAPGGAPALMRGDVHHLIVSLCAF
jgi:hypothetical protein